MADEDHVLTQGERDANQRAYDARLAALAGRVEAMPEPARLLVLKYRRHVELCGRAGPKGSALRLVEEFVEDVERAFDAYYETCVALVKPCDRTHRGRGL